ncbi:hypothetical protein RYX36_017616 [Vicia faba]
MASSSSSSNKVSMKLLIDTKNQKVLFAEASKPVIDFLFNLLCLPIGTVVKLLSANNMVGSLGNLYESVENLNQNYMQPNQTKDVLLNPKAQCSSTEISGFLTQNDYKDDTEEGIKLYMCQHRCRHEPMSTISSITLLNKFNIKEIGTLQEKVVEMGMDEGIKLLKASLQSKMVLTSVFIKKGC